MIIYRWCKKWKYSNTHWSTLKATIWLKFSGWGLPRLKFGLIGEPITQGNNTNIHRRNVRVFYVFLPISQISGCDVDGRIHSGSWRSPPFELDVGSPEWQDSSHWFRWLFRSCHDQGEIPRKNPFPIDSNARQCYGGIYHYCQYSFVQF